MLSNNLFCRPISKYYSIKETNFTKNWTNCRNTRNHQYDHSK